MRQYGAVWAVLVGSGDETRETERGVYVIDPLLEARSADKDDRYRILQH
jgi:hypothetical protein